MSIHSNPAIRHYTEVNLEAKKDTFKTYTYSVVAHVKYDPNIGQVELKKITTRTG